MPHAIIALGSNLGDREAFLDFAVSSLSTLSATRVLRVANRYDTEPVGVPSAFTGLRFLNSAVLVETMLAPLELLAALQRMEAAVGRVRTIRNGPRPLDLDIILYEGVTMETPELTLPHPRAHLRAFVLDPLADLGVSPEMLRANLLPEELQ